MTKPVRFLERDKETFDNMPKDNNAIYFVYDGEGNNVIYKGDVPYGGGGTAELPTYIGIGNTTVNVDSINNTVSISSPTLTAGSNITLSPDTVNNTITISADSGPDTGVGEWITEGETFVEGGTTYTVGKKVERFNCYANDTTLGVEINKAAGNYSHVEGASNKAFADYSHAEGNNNTVTVLGGHIEGGLNTLKGSSEYTHIEGRENSISANAPYAHIEGLKNKIENASYANYAHIEGVLNIIHNGNNLSGTHIEGSNNEAYADAQYSHIEGYGNIAMGNYDHIEGENNKTHGTGGYHHIEGYNNDTYLTMGTHIEGNANEIHSSNDSHIEGELNEVYDSAEAHVEGMSNKSYGGTRVHIEGYQNTIGESGNLIAQYSNQAHIEGFNNKIIKRSDEAHCEGLNNSIENSSFAHCEGTDCSIVNAPQAHAQNYHTQATARSATATGDYTIASGEGSFTMGYGTNASGKYQLTLGSFNVSNNTSTTRHDDVNNVDYDITKFPLIIGNGHDDFYDAEYRSDAFKVDCDGKIYVGDNNGVDVSGLNVTSNDNAKVLTASYSGGVGTYSWQDAPESSACIVHTYTNTSLPNKVVLDNNNEYRYINLTGATGITISIETVDMTKSFYSTVVLHNVTSTNTLSNFVSVSQDSVISNVIFLNENNVDLSISNTVEMLFFINGMSNSVMCIAYAYSSNI